MKRNQSTAVLTQGAVLTAIYLVLLLIVAYIPILNMVVIFFLPVPFMIHTYKHGLKSAGLVALATLILTPVIADLLTIIITFFAASVGLVMGYFFAQKKGAFQPLLAGIITYIINYLLVFLLAYLIFQVNVLDLIKQMMQETVSITEGTADYLNLPVEETQLELFKQSAELLEVIFPALLIMSSMLMGFLHYLVSRPILTRVGCPIESLPPFREWNLPKSLLYYYLISLILILIGLPEESSIYMIIANLHPILEILLLLQGLSVIAYFAYWKKMGNALPIIAVILLFIFPISHFVLRFLGIFELGFGLKQRMNIAEKV